MRASGIIAMPCYFFLSFRSEFLTSYLNRTYKQTEGLPFFFSFFQTTYVTFVFSRIVVSIISLEQNKVGTGFPFLLVGAR